MSFKRFKRFKRWPTWAIYALYWVSQPIMHMRAHDSRYKVCRMPNLCEEHSYRLMLRTMHLIKKTGR